MSNRHLGLGAKLMILLCAFGLAPALLVAGVLWYERSDLEKLELLRLKSAAVQINDTIDRNLFERYGDVQAFVVNTAAADPGNWRRPGADNLLVAAMDSYMANYGLYKLMLLVAPDGKVLAVNSRDADGKPLDTASVYDTSFAAASWLRKAIAGDFLKGKDGFTGTVVEGPAAISEIARLYKSDGFALTFAAPLKDPQGRVVAVWVNFAGFEFVEQIIAQSYDTLAGDGEAGAEITLLDAKGAVIVDYDPSARNSRDYRRDPAVIGKLNLAERVDAARLAVAGKTGTTVARHARKLIDQGSGYAHSTGAYGFPGLGWSVLVRVPVEQIFAGLNQIFITIFAIIGGAAVVLAFGGFLIGKRAAQPIRRMTDAMSALAGGNLAAEIPAQERKDEIGAMAAAVRVFKDSMAEAERLKVEQEASKAKAESEKRVLMNTMADEFEASVKGIVQTVSSASTELQSTAQSMTATAEETQRQSTAVAAASEQASTNVQTVASAAEELSSSIAEISRQVTESTRIAAQAVDDAGRTNTQVQALAEAAQKIGDVVKLINDIAGQTNLLALNATIEAARAGEAGKGFAVVASEVKSLATQTAKATEDIAAQVKSIQSATADSVQAIAGISATIGRVSEIATTIASAVEEQGAATQEIARNVQQASAGTAEVSSNIGGVTQAASETGAAASQVLSSSGELSKQSEMLRTKVDTFIATIRAA
jgi:methyl-accepting chemotaxis protein